MNKLFFRRKVSLTTEIRETEMGEVQIIRLSGKLSKKSVEESLKEIKAFDHKQLKVVLDITELTFISDTEVFQFIQAVQNEISSRKYESVSGEIRGKMVLVGVTGTKKSRGLVFIGALARNFEIRTTIERAILFLTDPEEERKVAEEVAEEERKSRIKKSSLATATRKGNILSKPFVWLAWKVIDRWG